MPPFCFPNHVLSCLLFAVCSSKPFLCQALNSCSTCIHTAQWLCLQVHDPSGLTPDLSHTHNTCASSLLLKSQPINCCLLLLTLTPCRFDIPYFSSHLIHIELFFPFFSFWRMWDLLSTLVVFTYCCCTLSFAWCPIRDWEFIRVDVGLTMLALWQLPGKYTAHTCSEDGMEEP